MSVDQPRPKIWRLFSHSVLLKSGRVVFCGRADQALEEIARFGLAVSHLFCSPQQKKKGVGNFLVLLSLFLFPSLFLLPSFCWSSFVVSHGRYCFVLKFWPGLKNTKNPFKPINSHTPPPSTRPPLPLTKVSARDRVCGGICC